MYVAFCNIHGHGGTKPDEALSEGGGGGKSLGEGAVGGELTGVTFSTEWLIIWVDIFRFLWNYPGTERRGGGGGRQGIVLSGGGKIDYLIWCGKICVSFSNFTVKLSRLRVTWGGGGVDKSQEHVCVWRGGGGGAGGGNNTSYRIPN